jgi:SAM-dependent methyltransferase
MLKDLFCDGIVNERRLGQVFTPDVIVDYMVEQSVKARLECGMDKPLQILDPACGTGRFMLGIADYCGKNNIQYLMWNIDIDERMVEATVKHAEHYRIPAICILGDALLNDFRRAWKVDNGTRQEIDVQPLIDLFNKIVESSKNK